MSSSFSLGAAVHDGVSHQFGNQQRGVGLRSSVQVELQQTTGRQTRSCRRADAAGHRERVHRSAVGPRRSPIMRMPRGVGYRVPQRHSGASRASVSAGIRAPARTTLRVAERADSAAAGANFLPCPAGARRGERRAPSARNGSEHLGQESPSAPTSVMGDDGTADGAAEPVEHAPSREALSDEPVPVDSTRPAPIIKGCADATPGSAPTRDLKSSLSARAKS